MSRLERSLVLSHRALIFGSIVDVLMVIYIPIVNLRLQRDNQQKLTATCLQDRGFCFWLKKYLWHSLLPVSHRPSFLFTEVSSVANRTIFSRTIMASWSQVNSGHPTRALEFISYARRTGGLITLTIYTWTDRSISNIAYKKVLRVTFLILR